MSDDLDALLEVKTSARMPASQLRTEGVTSSEHIYASSVMTRYQDAYLVARVTTGFGGVIKGLGFLLAFVIFGAAAFVGNQAYGETKTMYMGAGLVLAIVTGAVFYLFGILVSAQGQILKASLDGAVNNSPFLTNDQKAQAMSLR